MWSEAMWDTVFPKRTLRTDENGMIVDESRNWFAVLEPKNLSEYSILPPPESEETSLEDWDWIRGDE